MLNVGQVFTIRKTFEHSLEIDTFNMLVIIAFSKSLLHEYCSTVHDHVLCKSFKGQKVTCQVKSS